MTNYNTIRVALGTAIGAYQSELSVYYYVPRTLVPPAAIVQPKPHRTISYMRAQSSGLAEWNFNVLLVVGLVNEQSAQDQVGELVSPGSPLIRALQNAQLPNGFVQVTDGSISEMTFEGHHGQGLYTYAQLSVVVTS